VSSFSVGLFYLFDNHFVMRLYCVLCALFSAQKGYKNCSRDIYNVFQGVPVALTLVT